MGAANEAATITMREDSGPPTQAFELEVTTRPMISFVWIGTLLIFFGGLISMRRRILENRLDPVADLAPSAPAAPALKTRKQPRRRTAKPASAKPAPSLMTTGKGGGR